MKKIIVAILVFMLVLVLPITASAAEVEETPEDTEGVISPAEDVDAPGSSENAQEEVPTQDLAPAVSETFSDKLVKFITKNYTGSALFTFATAAIADIIYTIKKNKAMGATIGTLNNNSVTIAKNAEEKLVYAMNAIQTAYKRIEEYGEKIDALLDKISKDAEEKATLEQIVNEVNQRLELFKRADMELADELAELLNLSRLPNSVKDELYARHISAKALIEGKVKNNDGSEA